MPEVVLVACLASAATSRADWSGVVADQRGPALTTPVAQLERSLSCTYDVGSSNKQTVLLVHGTGGNEEEDFGWNFMKVLPEHVRVIRPT